ncbi:MFS transporter [Gulosibacter bifidus]|uniref:MFS transporter n=1 Tax=Gulosibacter bifidus TaxID=272239 RepID=A0ABW5RJH0_9MICO|nr:MFS transporter [Gulosibacter bifidus]
MTNAGFSQTGTTWIGHRRGTRDYSRIQLAMLLAGIATFAQLYAPQAVLPQVSQGFGVTTAESSLMVSASTVGLAVAVVPWTLVADRIGRKRSISIAIIAATILGLCAILAPNFQLALLIRLFEGFALGGVPAAAMAYLNEEVHKIDSAAASGMFVAGNTIGGLSGRLVSGPVGELTGSWQLGVLSVSTLALVAALLFMFLSPTPQGFTPLGPTQSVGASVRRTVRNAWEHLHDRVLLAIYLQPFVMMGGFVAIYNYLGYYLTAEPYSLPVWLASFAFVAYLAGAISSPISGRLGGEHGRKRVKLASDAISLVGLGIMLIPNLWAIVAGLIVFTTGFFASHAISIGWAAAHPKNGRAQSSALYNFTYYFGSSVFGFVGGLFYQSHGWISLIAMVAVIYLVAIIIAIIVLPTRPTASTRT